MRHLLQLLLLWTINYNALCAEHVVDGDAVLRLRTAIRKIPHSSDSEQTTNVDDEPRTPTIDKTGTPRAISPSFMQQLDEISFGNIPSSITSVFQNRSFPQVSKSFNHSANPGNAVRIYAAPTSTAISIRGKNGRRGMKRIREAGIPWRRVIPLPKVRAEQRPIALRTAASVPSLAAFTQGNSDEMALLLNHNNPQPSRLLPFQLQQQTYRNQQSAYGASIPAQQSQQPGAAQPAPYYNPWDPLGLLNNPFWKSLFPGLSAPQPQSLNTFAVPPQAFSSSVPQPAQSLDSQQGFAAVPKKSRMSPNQKLALCCQKRNLSPSCQNLCNYDTFTDRSLVTAVITNQCPGSQLETAFNCATAMADHSACCIRNGIGAYNGGHCMPFCTTHMGNPGNTLQYIDCLQVFDRIKNCYREYHLTHPNIYGDF